MPPATSSAPVPGAPEDLSAVLSEELAELRKEVEALVEGGLSEEDAQGLLEWAQQVEGRLTAVASVLSNPTPESVSRYLRFVAAGIEKSRDRRFASRSLRVLRSALCRM